MATNAIPGSFQGMTAVTPTSLVELSVKCNNLIDSDVFSKSDPMCVFYVQEFGQQKWMEFGRTEMILNDLNPEFTKKFELTYYFEETQRVKFELYDIDSSSPNLSDHDFLGAMETTLGEIIAMSTLVKPLIKSGIQRGTITVTAEELAGCKEEITLQFMGRNIEKKSSFFFINTTNPFLTLSKSTESGAFVPVYRTEYLSSSNPVWRQFTLSVQTLCNGDYDRIIRCQCHHYKMNGNHKLIGESFLTLKQLSEPNALNAATELIHPTKQTQSTNYKNSGQIVLLKCQKNPIYTFLDYVSGGKTELLCTFAIDFTASNGNPQSSTSLHYIDMYNPNQYVQALRAVGEIIQDYDSDKLFPVLGFGARLPPDGIVSHEFFVTMDPSNPYCAGLDNIINAYHNCLTQVQLYGPTNFAPIINHVAGIARAQTDGSKYHILLILTDGIITDMVLTKEAIVNASNLPFSVIIVGVGQADFAAMEELDGDVVRLSSRGRYAERDIVQFVPFRDFQTGLKSVNYKMVQAKLAKSVLAEIPTQFLSFMKKNGIKPGNMPSRNLPSVPQMS